MDLSACLLEAPKIVSIRPNETRLIPCGFAIQLESGYEAQIRPRSGLAKIGITIPNSPGTIDAGFRDQVQVLLRNEGGDTFHVKHGDRIAQMVVQALPRVTMLEVDELEDSERGTGGFGSTGLQ